MTGVELVIDGLAVGRLTQLVVDDRILDVPRDAVLAWLDSGGGLERKVAEGLRCPVCTSVWIAAGAAVASRVVPRTWRTVARVAAVAAIAGFVADRELS